MKKIVSFAFIIAMIVNSGCSKDYLSSLQNDPNNPSGSAATVQLVLPGAITDLVTTLNGSNAYQAEAVWIGYWNYAGGYSFNNSVQNYILTNTTFQIWDNYYDILTNLNVIKQLANGSPELADYGAISDVMSAICFKNLVDAYNDVPYSKALKGQGDFFPSYDKGSDIYDSLVLKLDNAMTVIKSNLSGTTVTLPTTDDVMFGGDMSQWILLANTIKLKLLVQQSNVAAKQAYIKAEIAKTASVGYLNADALVNPGYTSTKPSPLYSSFGTSPGGGVNGGFNYLRSNGYAINFYKSTNDPRLGYIYGKNGTSSNTSAYYSNILPIDKSSYSGDVLGIQATPTNNSAPIGPGLIKNASQSAVMMLAAESYFVQSEAIVRGYLTGNAEQLYQNGITASFEYLNVGDDPDTYATAYYSQSNVTNVSWPSSAASQIQAILTQKWAALDGTNAAEPWNDWRRTFNSTTNTGYPVVPVSASPTNTEAHMPFRLYYPLEEPNTNQTNWAAAGGDKVDPFTSKIFWMP